MLNAVQQTPMAFDPARQQITPPPPAAPVAPQRAADIPIQAGAAPQDKFNPRDDRNRNRRDRRYEEKERAEAAQNLRTARRRLEELRGQARAAVLAGDANDARDAAEEAARVAGWILAAAGRFAAASFGAMQTAAADRDHDSEDISDMSAALDLARSGLGAAKDVVDAAITLPYHPIADRHALGLYMHEVVNAMTGIEEIAANFANSGDNDVIAPVDQQHIDIKA
jgi:hypothetical protein